MNRMTSTVFTNTRRLWSPPLGLVASTLAPRLSAMTPRSLDRAFGPLQFQRFEGTMTGGDINRPIITDFGVLDRFVPLPSNERPSLLTTLGWKYRLRALRSRFATTFNIGVLKTKAGKFNTRGFLDEAVGLYQVMNEAFATGDRKLLQHICLPAMYSKLKGDMKRRTHTIRWQYVGEVEPATLVALQTGRLASDVTLAQAVVRIHSKQAVEVFNKENVCISSNVDQPTSVVEYVIFQRIIAEGDNNHWQVYGKTKPTPLEAFQPQS
ncbi:hypothetical protein IWQ62_005323 [Dispira parvispora]|uniref:Large ribosomal subunit protein mL45 n=1 Tax=Dispira parvispora TaxID=1520584 RepID=A0A9W8AR77_9FUNG|nr:hypothetical protein IWQ62_005323 [Dispira parvispora]